MPTSSADSRASILGVGRCLVVTAEPRVFNSANSSKEIPASSWKDFLSGNEATKCHQVLFIIVWKWSYTAVTANNCHLVVGWKCSYTTCLTCYTLFYCCHLKMKLHIMPVMLPAALSLFSQNEATWHNCSVTNCSVTDVWKWCHIMCLWPFSTALSLLSGMRLHNKPVLSPTALSLLSESKVWQQASAIINCSVTVVWK